MQELEGKIPGLPPGYTYCPTSSSVESTVKFSYVSNSPTQNILLIKKDKKLWLSDENIPDETLRRPGEFSETFDGSRIGLSNICPYAGYDPSTIDRKLHPLSAVYDLSYGKEEMPVDTYQPHPILLPSKLK